jgi:hypothetical protein
MPLYFQMVVAIRYFSARMEAVLSALPMVASVSVERVTVETAANTVGKLNTRY